METKADLGALEEALKAVNDPELPPLTLGDLGVIRAVTAQADGRVKVIYTPTYSGCPAIEFIEDRLQEVIDAFGYHNAELQRTLEPAWSSRWISDEGRQKLIDMGIAPPMADTQQPQSNTNATGMSATVPVTLGKKPVALKDAEHFAVPCPRCESRDTVEISRFGSTACKALHRCKSCLEPFDYVKPI